MICLPFHRTLQESFPCKGGFCTHCTSTGRSWEGKEEISIHTFCQIFLIIRDFTQKYRNYLLHLGRCKQEKAEQLKEEKMTLFIGTYKYSITQPFLRHFQPYSYSHINLLTYVQWLLAYKGQFFWSSFTEVSLYTIMI